jgi:hypothetical protein
LDQDLDIVVSGGFVLSCFLITWDLLRDILLRNGDVTGDFTIKYRFLHGLNGDMIGFMYIGISSMNDGAIMLD